MKKRLTAGICVVLCCIMLTACGDGSTTMDGGRDTDGKAGESTTSNDSVHNSTSGENGEGAQDAAENITGGVQKAIDNTTDAVDNAAKGAGNVIKDAVDNTKN